VYADIDIDIDIDAAGVAEMHFGVGVREKSIPQAWGKRQPAQLRIGLRLVASADGDRMVSTVKRCLNGRSTGRSWQIC